jgi:hypothetical protein
MLAACLHGDCTAPWLSVRDAVWRAQDRCLPRTALPAARRSDAGRRTRPRPVAGTGRVVLSGDLDQLPSRLGIHRQGTGRQADRGLSAWELACHASLTGAPQVSGHPRLSVSDRRTPVLTPLSGTQRARRLPESFWMQTIGATLVATKRRSLVRVLMTAHSGRSAHGLLYIAAVWNDACKQAHRQGPVDIR